MPAEFEVLDPAYRKELDELVRWWRKFKRERPREQPRQISPSLPDRDVMLLEELVSGQTAKAAVLEGDPNRVAYLITAFGEPTANATFDLTWQENSSSDTEELAGLSMYATPAELQASLESLSFVRPGDLAVQFGNHLRPIGDVDPVLTEFNVFRWIVICSGKLLAAPLPSVTASNSGFSWPGSEATILRDSGLTIEVRSTIPVGLGIDNNTPMRPGAICGVAWVEGVGWRVTSVEARHLLVDVSEVQY